MDLELSFTPPHHLRIIDSSVISSTSLTPVRNDEGSELRALNRAFSKSTPQGLFLLASEKRRPNLTPSARFWHSFAGQYLDIRCHTPSIQGIPITPLPSNQQPDFTPLLEARPPMIGSESLTLEVLGTLWGALDEWFCTEVNKKGADLTKFLEKSAPDWHQLGRLYFHLAENKSDPDHPFAFMATFVEYQADDTEESRRNARHKPLAQALQLYAGAKNRKALLQLLNPVQRAAESSKLISAMLEDRSIYQPTAWTPVQAYQFLRETPLYEQAGVAVRIPDWWRKRSKPQVKVTIESPGRKKGAVLTRESLLNFDVDLVLGEDSLTKAEWEQLFNAEEPLILLRGQWVEVDSERLSAALDHWKTVEQGQAQEGLSFVDGMRLLAGAPTSVGDDDITENDHWAFADAGPKLKALMDELNDPKALLKTEQTTLKRYLNATLRPYQEQGVSWLHRLTRLGLGACLADDMGLGKTIQIISLLLLTKQGKKQSDKPNEKQNEKSDSKASLLVLPTSLIANWMNEIERFAPSLRYTIAHSSFGKSKNKKKRDKEQALNLEQTDLVITTYGMLSKQDWLQEQRWQLLILDEAQAIKNPSTRQTRLAKSLEAESKVALTGTPVENRLGDLWSLFDFICPGLLGSAKSFKAFTKQLENREEDLYGPLRRLIRPYILRRLKTDRSIISDLPDKTEMTAFCQLTKKQATLYQKLVLELTDALEQSEEGMKRRGLVLAYLTRFKQLCNHPGHLLGNGEFTPSQSGKFERLKAICEEIAARQEKVLVFTQYREMTTQLAEFLETIFGVPGLTLDGSTAAKQRQKAVDAFQSVGGPPFFVLSIKAGGTGLNLTAACHVVHFDRWWNPAVENQATDRAFRIGQQKQVMVHKFVCSGTVEDKIDQMIREKSELANELLEERKGESSEQWITEMSNEELIDLVALDIDQVKV